MLNKEVFDFVIVVLVYKNTKDLEDFFKYYDLPNSKVIVVNSYFDDKSLLIFKQIAERYDAIFMNVENKGYGYGNNKGISYAINNFRFKYLIVSNADVMISNLSIDIISKYSKEIIAPQIIARRGRNQNPNMPYMISSIEAKGRYICYKNNYKALIYLFYMLSRLYKILFSFTSFKKCRFIYSAHGCFLILSNYALQNLYPLYNENMFLFYEELHLAKKALHNGIKTIYIPDIKIYHKEDGSVSLLQKNIFQLMKQSYIEYYYTWHK